MSSCSYCGGDLEPNDTYCSRCLRRANSADLSEVAATEAANTAEWQSSGSGAVYSIEQPARCPRCREIIRTVRVLRLKRSQVSFTSTLPRSGRVIVCPECDGILSADLSTL